MKKNNNLNLKKNHEDMDQDQQMLEMIQKSSEEIEIPEKLKPENIGVILSQTKKDKGNEKADDKKHAGKRLWIQYQKQLVAAALAIIIAIGAVHGGSFLWQSSKDEDHLIEDQNQSQKEPNDQDMIVSLEDQYLPKTALEGEPFYLASKYEDVYSYVNQRYGSETDDSNELYKEEIADINQQQSAEFENSGDINQGQSSMEKGETIAEDNSMTDDAEDSNTGSENEKDYSETNTMVEGIDEADIIKTDGKYLYVCKGLEIVLIDLLEKEPKVLETISLQDYFQEVKETQDLRLHEIYVHGDQLNAIVTYRKKPIDPAVLEGYGTYAEYQGVSEEIAIDDCIDPLYDFETDRKTVLCTFDLSDRENPKKLKFLEQDGNYYQSRKSGDYIYLFTLRVFWNVTEEEEVIPMINGARMAPDCIYLSEKSGGNQLIVTSMNIANPGYTVDQMALFHNGQNIYMSESSIYLYGWDDDSIDGTLFSKFVYKDGSMNAAGSAQIKGSVLDQFAVSERDGNLYVLTTVWDYEEIVDGETVGIRGEQSNALSIYNEKMEEIGSLIGIAEGESIYAARYIGDIAYFITYRNTDPLFAVDISDPKSPEILGNVEISGFSEYLHPYGDGKIFGIGYETDPEMGWAEGIKLVMFDTTDPTSLKILDQKVLSNAEASSSMYDYHSILVNAQKNLIGLETDRWVEQKDKELYENRQSYYVYSFENNKLTERFNKELKNNEQILRGIYVGDSFYLVTDKTGEEKEFALYVYDMTNQFQEIACIDF